MNLHMKSLLSSSRILILIAVYGVFTVGLATAAVEIGGKPTARAVMDMAWGLILLWVIGAGVIMRIYRDRIRAFILRIEMGWRLKFVVFATLLALIEEAITTTMTNLAPLFGVRVGEAYITASANYLDVILFHSVIIFIPMFIG